MIRYISTRGKAPALTFRDAVMAGLATDGGLYVPETIPQFTLPELTAMSGLSYTELALRIIWPFVEGSMLEDDLRRIIDDAYSQFRHPAIAPLKELREQEFLLELFHGPTLAFKDFALQLLGRVLEYFLGQGGERLTIVGATSGDTGSAAIEGCRGRANMRIFILHPKGRVSDIQRLQMTGVMDENVFNLAVEGTFDDCQDIVKTLFADHSFRERQRLTAVNSINWARILAQVVYYFYAAFALGAPAKAASFCVPTGNFGDIYAGYIAKRMGLPMGRLLIATNRNDILARTLSTGIYGMEGVHPSLSPSMDIQISSNFERLLFDLYGRDGETIGGLMDNFRKDKSFTLSAGALAQLRAQFAAGTADDALTLATIKTVHDETEELLDPHSAVGVAVGRAMREAGTLVTLATAHPAKFPDAVVKACGIEPALPAHLSDIRTRKEKFTTLPNDAQAVKQFIESQD